MIQHYFKSAFRHLSRQKINFGFKLAGLSLGVFSLLIIILYVHYQWSFDRFHTDHEQIFRVNSNRDENGVMQAYATVPPAIGPALAEAFPEITAYTRLSIPNRVMISYREKLFRVPGFTECDSSVFDLLTFQFIAGNKDALKDPGAVVLTESVARQIFGDEDPMEKVITSPDHSNRSLTVKAVVRDFPANAHLGITALHNFGSLQGQNGDLNSWEISWDGSVILFVKMADARTADLEQRSLPLLRANLLPTDDGGEKKFSISLQPIADIYLDKPLKMEFSKKGNPVYTYIFSVLGLFLMIIACINYVNLSIADFDTRSREMGIRKVLGARKLQIAVQTALEATVVTMLAIAIALTALFLLFPVIAEKLESNLRFEMLITTPVLKTAGVVIATLILFASAYPAYRLITRSPLQELKPNASHGNDFGTGNILLLVQYAISILCLCATIVIGRQISFLHEKDLGYDRSGVISLVMPDEYPPDRIPLLKNGIGNLAGVESTSYSYYLMPVSTYFKGWYQVERSRGMEKMLLNEMFVDHDYFETMGITVLQGRNFDRNVASDRERAFIINETAARELGWENPIGKKIRTGFPDDKNSFPEGVVIGVVRDFNTLSLHKKVEPVILRLQYDNWPGNALNVKVRGDVQDMLPQITSTYEQLMPGYLADARIVEDLYRRQYQNEDKAHASLQTATIIIMLISSVGIFSFSLYLSVRRMREFGIRKVMGATAKQIAMLHIRYFLKVALIANVIALPMAYWLMGAWLNDFAYRAELSVTVFAGVAAASVFLIIISGAYPALKSAVTNPVDVIRND